MRKLIDVILVVSMLLSYKVSTCAAEVKTVLSVSDNKSVLHIDDKYEDNLITTYDMYSNHGFFIAQEDKNVYVGPSGIVWENMNFEFYPVGELRNGLVPITIDGSKYGFADSKGNIIVPMIYDEVSRYKDGYAAVAQSGLFGLIDTSGELVIKPHYDDVYVINENLARVQIGEKFGLFSTKGNELLPCEYQHIGEACDSNGHLKIRKNDFEGVINSVGELVIPCKYSYIGTFSDTDDEQVFNSEGYAGVGVIDEAKIIEEYGIEKVNIMKAAHGGKLPYEIYCGIIDTNGNEVIPLGEGSDKLNGDVLICGNKLINLSNGITLETDYDYLYFCYDGFIHVSKEERVNNCIVGVNDGIIDENGNIIVECKYDDIECTSNGVFIVQLDEKCGAVNKNSIEIVPCVYDGIYEFYEENYLRSIKNSKEGIIDLEGNVITPCEHDEVDIYGDYICSVKSGKYALLNKQGNIILPYEYEGIFGFSGFSGEYNELESFVVVKDSKVGIMNTDFEYVLPLNLGYQFPKSDIANRFDYEIGLYGFALNAFPDDTVILEKNGKQGLVSLLNGGTLVSFEYDYVEPLVSGSLVGVANGESMENSKSLLLQYDGSERKDEYIAITMNRFPVITEELPVIENGRTLVPLRAVSEALGADISWDNASQTAIATLDGVTVSVPVGSNVIYKNNSPITIDVPAKIMNSRTYVPIRAITEAFGCDVQWNNASKTVEITS